MSQASECSQFVYFDASGQFFAVGTVPLTKYYSAPTARNFRIWFEFGGRAKNFKRLVEELNPA
jgi:hypothetical protein